MKTTLERPPVRLSPSPGPLAYEQFQLGYSTNDIDRACAVFADRYGIGAFRRLEGDMDGGGHIRIEIAWSGGVLYELIQASGPAGAFYNDRLPGDRFAIRHHHLGFLVPDADAWGTLMAEIEQGGWRTALRTDAPGFMRACYIEAPELDHYLEYMLPEPAGYDFFAGAPGA